MNIFTGEYKQATGENCAFHKRKLFLSWTKSKGLSFHILEIKQAGRVEIGDEFIMTEFLKFYILHLPRIIFNGKTQYIILYSHSKANCVGWKTLLGIINTNKISMLNFNYPKIIIQFQ